MYVRTGAVTWLTASVLIVAAAGAAEPVRIDAEGNWFSVDIEAPVPLASVLQLLGNKLNVTIEAGENLGAVGPISVSRERLDGVLRQLAPGGTFVIQYGGNSSAVSRIIVTSKSTSAAPSAQAPVRPVQAVEEVRSPAMDSKSQRAVAMRHVVELSYSRDAGSARELEALAKGSKKIEVRATALKALASVSQRGAVGFLAARLASDPSPEVRIAAAEALAMVDNNRSLAIIHAAISRERNESMKARLRQLISD
jgi:hypothetical protein